MTTSVIVRPVPGSRVRVTSCDTSRVVGPTNVTETVTKTIYELIPGNSEIFNVYQGRTILVEEFAAPDRVVSTASPQQLK